MTSEACHQKRVCVTFYKIYVGITNKLLIFDIILQILEVYNQGLYFQTPFLTPSRGGNIGIDKKLCLCENQEHFGHFRAHFVTISENRFSIGNKRKTTSEACQQKRVCVTFYKIYVEITNKPMNFDIILEILEVYNKGPISGAHIRLLDRAHLRQ